MRTDKSTPEHINCNTAENIIFEREQIEFVESAEKRRKFRNVVHEDHKETETEMFERFNRIIYDEIVNIGR